MCGRITRYICWKDWLLISIGWGVMGCLILPMSILIKKSDQLWYNPSQVQWQFLKKNYQEHKTVKKSDFNGYPEDEKTKTVSSVIKNIKRDDLWV